MMPERSSVDDAASLFSNTWRSGDPRWPIASEDNLPPLDLTRRRVVDEIGAVLGTRLAGLSSSWSTSGQREAWDSGERKNLALRASLTHVASADLHVGYTVVTRILETSAGPWSSCESWGRSH